MKFLIVVFVFISLVSVFGYRISELSDNFDLEGIDTPDDMRLNYAGALILSKDVFVVNYFVLKIDSTKKTVSCSDLVYQNWVVGDTICVKEVF